MVSTFGEPREVSYNPYKNETFVAKDGSTVLRAQVVNLLAVAGERPLVTAWGAE